MKLSYQLLCKNEDQSLMNLLSDIHNFTPTTAEHTFEVNVCRDEEGTNPDTLKIIESFKSSVHVNHYERSIRHTIHEQKNWLASKATGDYLFYLDADETLSEFMYRNLWSIIELNLDVDIFIFPRINTVEGLTQEYIRQRGWKLNDKGWINFPDWQDRLFKHNCDISFEQVPHGRLKMEGKKYTFLPQYEDFAIKHAKTFDKQVKDNNWHDNKERELGLRK